MEKDVHTLWSGSVSIFVVQTHRGYRGSGICVRRQTQTQTQAQTQAQTHKHTHIDTHTNTSKCEHSHAHASSVCIYDIYI